jgi:hypothetical protein
LLSEDVLQGLHKGREVLVDPGKKKRQSHPQKLLQNISGILEKLPAKM